MNRAHTHSRGICAPSGLVSKLRTAGLRVTARITTILSCAGVVCVALVLSLAPTVYAQTGTGSVRGMVTDPQGKAVTGAKVTMTNVDTAYSRSVTSDVDGNYGFQSLPIGRYILRVAGSQGFRSF